ncbi:MAG: translocation/assembly module TamB domain-containing protein [Usitatibacter sp.]
MSTPSPSPREDGTRRRRHWLWRMLAVIVALIVVAIGAVLWMLTTPQGARMALGRLQSLLGEGARLEGVEGGIGTTLRIKTIELSRPGLYVLVEGFEMQASAVEPLRGLLHIYRVAAKDVEIRIASSEEAAKIPVTFEPPYALRIDDASIGELRFGSLPAEAQAEKDVAKRRLILAATRDKDFVAKSVFVKGEGDRRGWTIAEARAETAYGKASVAGSLGTRSPFALDATMQASGSVGERPYRTSAKLKGTLEKIEATFDGEISGQRATARVLVEPFAAVATRSVEVRAQGVDLSQLAAGSPRTRLSLEVKLAGESKAIYAGPVRIENAQPGPWDRGLLPFTSASARVTIAPQRVDVTSLAVALIGAGSASGRATIRNGVVEADLRVADVDFSALHGGLQKTNVTGSVTAKGDRGAQRFEVALKDPRFEIEGRASVAREQLDVETVRVRTGGGAVVAKGGMALAGRRQFRFEGRAEHFDPAAFVKSTAGDLNFTFVASGTMQGGVAGEARIDIASSKYAGQPASGRIVIAGDASRIANADIQVALGEARASAKGSFGRAADAMDVTLHAPDLSLLAKPFGLRLAGRADADARLTGTFHSPAGRVNLTGANLVLPSDVHVREMTLKAGAGSEPGSPIDVSLQAKGVAIGKESPPTPLAETLEATLKGTRSAHRLDLFAQTARDSNLRIALQGGLDPRGEAMAWNGRVETLALTGRGAFALAGATPLAVSASRIELGEAQLRGEWGEARLEVTRWTPSTLDFKGTSSGIQVQNLVRSLRLGEAPRSTLVVAGDWDLHAAQTLEGSLGVHRVSGDLRVGEPPLALGLKELVVKVQAVHGRARGLVNISGERIGRIQGEGSGLVVRGATAWEFAKDAPVDARLVAEIPDLASIAPWFGPDAKAGGRLNANVVVSGTGGEPRFAGEARVQDLALREPLTGFEVEQGQVVLKMDGKSVVIEQFTAAAPWHPSDAARAKLAGVPMPASGTVSAEGSIDMFARKGSVRITARQVPFTQVPTRFVAMSGEAKLEAGATGLLASGDFKADAGWIGALDTPLPSVSDDVVIVRNSQAAAPQDLKAKREPIRIDLKLALGDHLYFQGRGLDTRLTGEMRVSGDPAGGLRATGAILTAGGTYEGYGQKLAIERGVLQFSGSLDNPRLDILALRRGLPVEPGVEVLGNATRPRVRLVSTPDVPEPEKLSWLVLGRGPSNLGPGDASVLVSAAASMLGKTAPGSDIGRMFGFDEVRIGRSDANSVLGVLPQSTVAGRTGTASAADVVSVGKRLGKNVNLTYEQGLADAEGALKISWQISQNFQILARAGFLPGLDAVYRWTFP